jgi:hypothetical protein
VKKRPPTARTQKYRIWQQGTPLRRHYGPSVTLLKNLIQTRSDWTENVNNVFKAADIEKAINNAVAPL